MRVRLGFLLCAAVAVAVITGSSTAASRSGASKLAGSPVTLAFIIDHTGLPGNDFGELSVGGRAAANYINTKLGGVNGHPIKITDCDSRLDPAATLTCANNAISEH